MAGRSKSELLVEKIYDHISAQVRAEAFAPGSKINENTIATSLQVSRTPVREALTKLAAEGLVMKVPRKGFFVCETDHEHQGQVYQVIGALDCLAASLADPFLTELEYRKMEELIAKMDIAVKFENLAEYSAFQQEFHMVYIEECGNSVLIDTITSLFTSPVPKTYVGGQMLFQLCGHCNGEHRTILELFQQHDMDRLLPLIDRHWKFLNSEQFQQIAG